MAITNDLIDEVLLKFSKKKAELNKDSNEIQGYMRSLQMIRTGDDDILPKDELTGEEMKKGRRDEVFNSVVKRAVKYLGEKK